jgi:hypothetical protein
MAAAGVTAAVFRTGFLRQCALTETPSLRVKAFVQPQPALDVQAASSRPLQTSSDRASETSRKPDPAETTTHVNSNIRTTVTPIKKLTFAMSESIVPRRRPLTSGNPATIR